MGSLTIHRLLKGVKLVDRLDSLLWLNGDETFTVSRFYQKNLNIRLQFFSEGMMHFDWR